MVLQCPLGGGESPDFVQQLTWFQPFPPGQWGACRSGTTGLGRQVLNGIRVCLEALV
jgi:hypothetical protein